MGKKDIERRVYTKEFKAEAVALAEKRKKPISHVVDFTPLSYTQLSAIRPNLVDKIKIV
jgi:hypothetical protein